ncbi:MAG: Hpt domain-containing protein [Cyanobacteria bacterium P01_H01_bin.121]
MSDLQDQAQLFRHVIHLPALYALADGDRLFAEELLNIFTGDARHQMQRLCDAVAAQDYAEIYQAAHALKGACASVGAVTAQATCQQLERQGRVETLQDAEQHLSRLQATLDEIYAIAQAETSIPADAWEQSQVSTPSL